MQILMEVLRQIIPMLQRKATKALDSKVQEGDRIIPQLEVQVVYPPPILIIKDHHLHA